MRKFFVTCMASLLSCTPAFAFWPEAMESSIEIGVGYRSDSFKWETCVDTRSTCCGSNYDTIPLDFPTKIRSEVKWKDLDIWQIEAQAKYITCDNIYLRAYGDYGWITGGHHSDEDFIDFDGTATVVDFSDDYYYYSNYSCSRGKSRRGHVYDASVAVGYQFRLCDDSFSIAPLIGYSWNGQHLRIGNGRFDDSYSYYDSSYSDSSSIHGLHSRYKTRWNTWLVGFDADYRIGCEWSLFATYEFHWGDYHANADWNLRSDLPHGFHHHSKRAYANLFTIGGRWEFCECWTFGVTGRFQWWRAHHGRDRSVFASNCIGDVDVKCLTSIPLKNVRWDSAGVSIDLGYVF